MVVEYLILFGAWFTSLGVLLTLAHLTLWRFTREKKRSPISEKLLRGPGESLRKNLEEIEDQLSETLAVAFFVPSIYASVAIIQFHRSSVSLWGIGIIIAPGVVYYAFLCRKLLRLLQKKRKYRLGLGGELAVGEELNQLMLAGCRVFHDVPNLPYGNIDHVLVAPCGVYAVETKARRKSNEGKDAHRAVFDGSSLQFGAGPREFRCLEQAKQQASRLSDWISKATGEAVFVQPVLALPGWWVDRKGRGDVYVVSGREVKSLAKGRERFGGEQIARIVHQLQQACRDVEF